MFENCTLSVFDECFLANECADSEHNSNNVIICRSLGVHFSKVRSLTLDTWEPELLKVKKIEIVLFFLAAPQVGAQVPQSCH